MPVGHKAHQLTMFIMRTISPCCSTFNSCKCNYRISTSSSSTQLHVTKNAINTLLTNDLSECVHIVWNRWQRWIENEVTKITNLKHFCKKKKKDKPGWQRAKKPTEHDGKKVHPLWPNRRSCNYTRRNVLTTWKTDAVHPPPCWDERTVCTKQQRIYGCISSRSEKAVTRNRKNTELHTVTNQPWR